MIEKSLFLYMIEKSLFLYMIEKSLFNEIKKKRYEQYVKIVILVNLINNMIDNKLNKSLITQI
jgi:hypothetical protein